VLVDPVPFGMGVTALEALGLGVPVVTLPSRQTVPALAAGMLRLLGLEELIVESVDEQVSVALRISRDGDYRAQIIGSIERNIDNLFSQRDASNEWKALIIRLASSSAQGL
jgi:protein O-GlcNAc transferase